MSLNRNKENSERRMTARSEENIELVKKILENNPNLTRICLNLNLSCIFAAYLKNPFF